MARDILFVRQKHHRAAVGRDVWKPVIELVGGYLLLIAAVGFHPPDLHCAGANRIEINELAVRRVLWAVVQPRGRRQAGLVAAPRGDGIDVEFAAALTAKGQHLAARRPAVPVRRTRLRDKLGRSPRDWQRIDERLSTSPRL